MFSPKPQQEKAGRADSPDDRLLLAELDERSGMEERAAESSAILSERPDATLRTGRLGRRLRAMVPGFLVVASLASLAYLGHTRHWKVPRFSELLGGRAAADTAWCEEHGVPEEICIACNADLMPKGRLFGWCKEHGVHGCVLHHPETAQLSDPPKVVAEDFERARRALELRPRKTNNPRCKLHLRRIQFASLAAVRKAGIDIRLVDRAPVVEQIEVAGRTVYDPTRVARVAARLPATVRRIYRTIGERVQAGDTLALLDAADVGRTKAELMQALALRRLHDQTVRRLQQLGEVVAGKRLLEAQAARTSAELAARSAVQRLQNWGLPISLDQCLEASAARLADMLRFLGVPRPLLDSLGPPERTDNLLPITAPRSGVIVRRNGVAGEAVDNRTTLFTIVDTSRMWLILDVPLEDVPYVRPGQPVLFTHDGTKRTDRGVLTWVATDVDRETRTVQVRAELANSDGHLKSELFGIGRIVLREDPRAIVVPSRAIHWEGCCHVVFVRDKDFMEKGSYKVFHTRSVRPGVAMGDLTEVIAGLLPGEVVVTEGGAALRAELLKGNLGAG